MKFGHDIQLRCNWQDTANLLPLVEKEAVLINMIDEILRHSIKISPSTNTVAIG